MTNNSINTSIPIEVTKGGTEATSFVAYAPIVGGITSTGALQSVASAGTAGQFLVSGGPSALPTWQTGGGGGGFTSVNVQTFTTSGTYTPTAGMVQCIVEVLAGGAGGGSTTSTTSNTSAAAGGGGAGEYRRGVFTAATIGASQTVTVGNGGGSQAAGGNSSFGSLITCNAGSPPGQGAAQGYGAANAGRGGANGTGGYIACPGNNGSPGFNYEGAVGTTAATIGGHGGNTIYGQGGFGYAAYNSGTGSAGQISGDSALGHGAGGAGGISWLGGGASNGGAGAPGIVIVTEFIG